MDCNNNNNNEYSSKEEKEIINHNNIHSSNKDDNCNNDTSNNNEVTSLTLIDNDVFLENDLAGKEDGLKPVHSLAHKTQKEVDGNELKDLRAEVAALKSKVSEQDNEILILKTCICEIIRKVDNQTQHSVSNQHQYEGRKTSGLSGSGLASTAIVLPSAFKTTKGDSPNELEKLISPRRNYSRRDSSEVGRQQRRSESDIKTPPLKVFQRRGSGTLRRSMSQGMMLKDEGASTQDETKIKFYIRGRALSFYPPSNFRQPKTSGSLPSKTLALEWVYGYRGRDCRNNLLLISNGDLVYNIAAVVILFNREKGIQRHYTGHNDDIKCIAVHPNGVTMASGQVAGHDKAEGKPHVRIWQSDTLETLHVIGLGDFERAVCCLSFSTKDDGKYLAAIDESNEHVTSLWDWKRESKLSENKGYNEAVFGLEFNPVDASTFITYGRSHIAFWTINEEEKIVKKMGVFEKYGKPKYVLCAAHTGDGDVITGDSNGNILVWSMGSTKIKQIIKEAHQGGVFALCLFKNGNIVSGGGKDRRIIEWTKDLKPTNNHTEVPSSSGGIRCIIESGMDETCAVEMIVGTTKNCLLDGTFDNGLGSIVQGHVDEMWGLAVHPNQSLFATCAYDNLLILWDANMHTSVWKKNIEENAQTAAFHPVANVLVVGTRSGKWLAFDYETQELLTTNTDSKEQIDVMKFSPDGKLLAIGSHEKTITIYQNDEGGQEYEKLGKLSGHSSFVTHLDWSTDGQYIQTNSGDYELLYWHASSCRQIVSASAMKDVTWQSWTCVFGFPVIGIWPEGADGTDINTCCRSINCDYVATGDDFGKVNLFAYPSTAFKAPCHAYNGHSSHVTCVRFTSDGERLLSAGGKDSSVMQWKLTTCEATA